MQNPATISLTTFPHPPPPPPLPPPLMYNHHFKQSPGDIIMKMFEKPTEDLQCTARSQSSVVAELYHCVNGTGVPLDNCRRGLNTTTGTVNTNCTVTIHAENDAHTFYCIERMLFDRTNILSAQYSVVVVSGKPLIGGTPAFPSVNLPNNTSCSAYIIILMSVAVGRGRSCMCMYTIDHVLQQCLGVYRS